MGRVRRPPPRPAPAARARCLVGVRLGRGGGAGAGVDRRRRRRTCRPSWRRGDGSGACPRTTAASPRRRPGRVVTATTPTTDHRSGGASASQPVGRLVDGNRVLVIGDSILASISNRHGGQLCDRLVPRGLGGRGRRRDRPAHRVRPAGAAPAAASGWDAAVVMLGSNYGGDPVAYGAELDRLLDELGADARRAGQRHRVQAGPRRGQLRDRRPRPTRATTSACVDWASRTRDARRAARRRRPAPQRAGPREPSPR